MVGIKGSRLVWRELKLSAFNYCSTSRVQAKLSPVFPLFPLFPLLGTMQCSTCPAPAPLQILSTLAGHCCLIPLGSSEIKVAALDS